ncbi:hypothetical protein G6F35_014438 [Rhizopus arrhizus]|nr:hypothetical protein G6F35_014438 [Rhizopus arrhizus]
MEHHARAQLEHPLGLIGGIHVPGQGQAGNQHTGAVLLGQVPLGQAVVHRNTGEAVALEPLVRLAQRARDVPRRHTDAQHLFGMRRGRREGGGARCRQRERGGQGFDADTPCLHCGSPGTRAQS